MNSFESILQRIAKGESVPQDEIVPYVLDGSAHTRAIVNYHLASAFLQSNQLERAKACIERSWVMSKFNSEIYPLYKQIHAQCGDIPALQQATKRLIMQCIKQGNWNAVLQLYNQSIYVYNEIKRLDEFFYDFDMLFAIEEGLKQFAFNEHPWKNEPKKKLRIAYVLQGYTARDSPHVRLHSSYIEHYNQDEFEIATFITEQESTATNCFHHAEYSQTLTKNGAKLFFAPNESNDIERLRSVAQNIYAYKPDVLVFSASLLQFEQYALVCMNPAPVMMAYSWGPQPIYIAPQLHHSISMNKRLCAESIVDTTRVPIAYEPATIKRSAVKSREELGISSDATILVSAGRFVKYQNPQMWSAINDVLSLHPKAVYMALGAKDLANNNADCKYLHTHIAPQNRERVKLIEWNASENYLATLAAGDIFLDTYPAGGGMTLLDAMSLGMPVVTFQDNFFEEYHLSRWMVGDEVVSNSELTASRDNYNQWKQIVASLIESPAKRAELGEYCKSRATSGYSSPQEMVRCTEKAYITVCSHHGINVQTKEATPTELPLVSIVIPCYNGEATISDAVESALSQTYAHCEVVVVNDGSTDFSAEVLRELQRTHGTEILHVIETENRGVSAARNTAIGHAKGEFIVTLDADDMLAATFVEETVRELINNQAVDICYTHIQHFGAENSLYAYPDFDATTLIHTENVIPVTACYRKSMWERIGGYDESIIRGYEDWEYWIRAVKHGSVATCVHKPLFLYRKQLHSRNAESNAERPANIASIVCKHAELYDAQKVQQAKEILAKQREDFSLPTVLFACSHFHPSKGGVETIVANIGEQLVQRGYNVEVATWAMDSRTTDVHNGVRILSLDSTTMVGNNPAWILQLRMLAQSGRYKAVVIVADPLNQFIWSMQNLQMPEQTRLILQPIINQEGYAVWRNHQQFVEGLSAILKENTTIALTESGADAEFFGRVAIPAQFIPNAVQPADTSTVHLRNLLGCTDQDFVILHVANFYDVKNHKAMLQEFESAPAHWKLVLIGNEGSEANTAREVRELANTNPRVTIIEGADTEYVHAAMKEASVLILGSKAEAAPVVVLEAMCNALPWIATPECGFVNELCGGVVAPLSEFVEVLSVLERDSALRKELGAIGFEHWKEAFQWSEVIESWIDVIETGAVTREHRASQETVNRQQECLDAMFGSAYAAEDLFREVESLSLSDSNKVSPTSESNVSSRNESNELVSVIIPCFNQEQTIEETLHSVLQQTMGNIEVVVVNDGSTDNSVAVVESVMNAYPQLQIRLVHQENRGLAAARNTGVAHAKGTYILPLDGDDTIEPTFVEECLNVLRDDEIHIAYTDTHEFGDVDRVVPSIEYSFRHQCIFNFMTCSSMYKREVFDAVRGYKTEMKGGYEDWEFWISAGEKGYKAKRIPKALFNYRKRAGSMYNSDSLAKDALLKAKIIRLHPGIYNEMQQEWAQQILCGETPAMEVPQSIMPCSNDWQPGNIVHSHTTQIVEATEQTKKNVLFTMYGWDDSGGGTTFPKALAKQLVRDGYNVTVFFAGGNDVEDSTPYLLKYFEIDGVQLFGVYNRPAMFTDELNPLREIRDESICELFNLVLDDAKPDVVHFHNFHGLTLALAEEVYKRNIPSCYTPHNYHIIDPKLYLFNKDLSLWKTTNTVEEIAVVHEQPQLRDAYLQRMDYARNVVSTYVTHTLAVSTRQKELLVEFGCKEENISVVNQAHESVQTLLDAQVQNTSVSLPLRIGFIGGVLSHKGVHMLIRAVQAIPANLIECKIYGFVVPEFKKKLQEYDTNNVVQWMGEYKPSDLPRIATEIDCTVIPSIWEDCAPLVVLESLAMGLPVIGSNIGGIPDFIRHNHNGFLYTHNSLEELALAIAEYIKHPELLQQHRANIRVPLTFKLYTEHIKKVYSQLMNDSLDRSSTQLFFHQQVNTALLAHNQESAIQLDEEPEQEKLALMLPQEEVNIENSSNAKDSAMMDAQKNTNEAQLNIIWEGTQFRYHSLALVNRELCSSIIDSGVANLAIIPYEEEQFSPEGNPRFEKLWKHDVRSGEPKVDGNKFVWIRHQYPPKNEVPRGAKWVIMQPWELSQHITEYMPAYKECDEIWTPSNYSRQTFINAGIDPNKVQVIPNGVNTEIFTPAGAVPALPTTKKFKMLFVGGTIPRKGIDILLSAYVQAFTKNDDVCLVIKDMGTESIYKGKTAHELIESIRQNPNAPEILYTNEYLSEEQMAEMYRACDVFVSPYRAEGFSLPTLEAMSCGLPVIVTAGGATDDFVDDTVGYTIPAGKRELGSVVDGYQLTGDAYMLEPDVECLVETLKFVVSTPQDVRAKGIKAAHRARTQWSWKRATMKMFARLDFLYGTSMAFNAQETLLDSEDAVVYFTAAEEAHSRGNIDEAIRFYHCAFEMQSLPKKYMLIALCRMATFCLLEEDTDLCREYLNKVADIDDSHADAIYVASIMYAMEGQWSEALNCLTDLLDAWHEVQYQTQLGITLDTLLCDSARALLNSGAVDEARELYSKALELNPENPDACYGVALCFKGIGAVVEAKTMLEWAIKLKPELEDVRQDFEETVA